MSPLSSFAAGFAIGVRDDVLGIRLVAAPAMSVAAAETVCAEERDAPWA
jgi:hypothetical protein